MIRSVSSEGRLSIATVSLSACVAALVFGAPNPARAEGSSVPDPAAAALFQAGRDLLDRGNWKDGCAKFEASMILYPAASTLLNIARCYEHDGKLALAWSAYQRALVINRETQGEERRKSLDEVARKGLASVEPRVPRIKIVVPSGAPSGLRISHNGKEVPEAMVGTVIPVDPGPQSVLAEAPGYAPFSRTVDAAEGKIVDVSIDLAAEGKSSSAGRHIPTWAFVAGGGGVALLAGAAVFRIDQAYIEGKQSGICRGDVVEGCPSAAVYTPDGDNARKNRDNALFIGLGAAGAVALTASIVGIALAPKVGATTAVIAPIVTPGGWGAGIGGRF